MRCDRRQFLLTSGLGLGAAALCPSAFAAANRKTKHVVLVALAGGVRSKETIESPDNIPNLMRIAGGGVVCPNVKAENVGHYGAALSLFTGNVEVFGIREYGRSENPTLFEYLRKGLALPANSVWLSTTNGNQQTNFSYGVHPKYGQRFGANLISADGVFNAEFKQIVNSFGTPKIPSEQEADVVAKMRDAIDLRPGEKTLGADAVSQRSVEQFILEEIGGKTVSLTGPGASDAKALRVASNILRVFKPTFLGVALQEADIAHNSFNGYVEIIRRNDAEIGRLYDTIQQDPELRDSTTMFVVPEFGRDRDLNERNGLDHGDGSTELNRVAMFAWGADIRANKTVKESIATIDLAPTICHLFDVKAELARGKVLRSVLA
ncbi:MAG: hypothetical protein JNL94_18430 [Planctomycetes bacterium]|nr:hypothetical protein [Planctomycetota bacterium]